MSFAGLNFVAILVAAVAGWLAGAVWYTVLSRPWVSAQGKTPQEFRRQGEKLKGTLASYLPFVVAFVAELLMAWMLAGVLGHLGPGQVTIRNGVISAAFLWFGFVLTTVAVNNMFAMRKPLLTVIDAAHWLVVLLLMGAVIGAFGV
jgi:hypothetical protein